MIKTWLIISFLLFGFAIPKLNKTKVAEGITISLPASLIPMTQDDLAQRYPSIRAPLGAYTNEMRSADFSVNTSATQWPDDNIEMAKKFFRAGITNLYDRVDFISEGIHEVNSKKFIFFEFESRINGTKLQLGETSPIYRYTYIQYYIQKERALVFSFNCARDQRSEWQETVRAIMKTPKIKP